MDDFVQRVNSDLIGKITNLASRGAQMLGKKLDGRMGALDEEGRQLLNLARSKSQEVANHYQNRDFNRAVQAIRSIADEANRYFEHKEPWKMVKVDAESTRTVLTTVLNVFRVLAIYLKPILPHYVQKVEALFGEEPYDWAAIELSMENREIQKFQHLAQRIDPAAVEKMVDSSKVEELPSEGSSANSVDEKVEYETLAPEVGIDDIFKSDLRIAKIISAEDIPEAGKLLRLKVDLGFEQREILAGIKAAYKPEELVGRLTLVAANLKPRKMKFGVSQGMVMAAGPGGKDIFLLSPDSGAQPGQRVG
jgi:methionyl-tRNA synthetase